MLSKDVFRELVDEMVTGDVSLFGMVYIVTKISSRGVCARIAHGRPTVPLPPIAVRSSSEVFRNALLLS